MGGEDVLAVAEAPEERERGVEDEGPDQQYAGHGQPGVVLRRDDGLLTTLTAPRPRSR